MSETLSFNSVKEFYEAKLKPEMQVITICGVFDGQHGEPMKRTNGEYFCWARLQDEPITGYSIKVILDADSSFIFNNYKGERIQLEGILEADPNDKTPNAVRLVQAHIPGFKHKVLTPDERKNLSIVRQVIFKGGIELCTQKIKEDSTIKEIFELIKQAAQESGIENWLLGKE